MKKTFLLLSFMLMVMLGHAQPDYVWDYEPISVDEIQPGEDHFYVLQQGINPTVSHSYFLSSNKRLVPKVDDSCIFNFVIVGEKEAEGQTFKIYAMKSVDKNGYFIGPRNAYYSPNISDAYRFTMRHAKEKNPDLLSHDNWIEYSNAAEGTHTDGTPGLSEGAEALNTWVLCHPDKFEFITFNGGPVLSTRKVHCTNWLIIEVKKKQLTAFEKFMNIYDTKLSSGITTEMYPVGTNPGHISQELFDKLVSVYAKATDFTADINKTDAEYDAMRNEILDVFAEYDSTMVRVVPGKFYVVENNNLGYLISKNNRAIASKQRELPKTWTLDDMKILWKFEDAGDQNFYIKNYATGRYMTGYTGNAVQSYQLVDNPTAKYTLPHRQADIFHLSNGQNLVSASNNGSLAAAAAANAATHWRFYEVDSTLFVNVTDSVKQSILDSRLAEKIKEAATDTMSIWNASGLSFDGNYFDFAKGLVTKFAKCNATETSVGSEAAPFDGDGMTFYHTSWNKGEKPDGYHWVEVDLGKEVSGLYLKATRHWTNFNSTPSGYKVVAPAEGEDVDGLIWSDTLCTADTVIFDLPGMYGNVERDSSTFVHQLSFKRPVQHLRFMAHKTPAMIMQKLGGPCWTIAEMRMYDEKDCHINPSYLKIPTDTLQALANAIAEAKIALENHASTQELIDHVDEALKAMWRNYPNPNALPNYISKLQRNIDLADDTQTGIGYYQTGAKAAFQAVLDKVTGICEKETLDTDGIQKYREELGAAFETFKNQLILPEDGFYYINSYAVNDEGQAQPVAGSFMSTNNAVNGVAVWKYKEDESIEARMNTIWYLEKSEDRKFSLRNLATGLYLNNHFEGYSEEYVKDSISVLVNTPVSYSTEPSHFTLGTTLAGSVVFGFIDGQYLNASGSGAQGPVVIWHDAFGPRSRWTLEAVDPEVVTVDNYRVDCNPGSVQILSMPLPLSGVYPVSGSVYKVLGVKDNAIQLSEYGESEAIPAGTPFIISTEDENFIEVTTEATTMEEMLALPFKYSPVTQNGMVSSPYTFNAPVGYGVIKSGEVVPTTEDEQIVGGTGFFNNAIPITTEDGVKILPLKGDIIGEGTGVADVQILKNDAVDVYSIAGVKVRNMVKRGSATVGLPKGIYIVSGQKIIIK